MLSRAIGALALALLLSSSALAGSEPGVMQRMSCSLVRYYVGKYSVAMAEMWARGHGATEAQIDAARRCLRDQAVQTAQRGRWYME